MVIEEILYDPRYHCRVCGAKQDEPPWGESGDLPNFQSCDCCGAESGYSDTDPPGCKFFRKFWIQKEKAEWIRPDRKPNNWSLEEQLKLIPPGYRDEDVPGNLFEDDEDTFDEAAMGPGGLLMSEDAPRFDLLFGLNGSDLEAIANLIHRDANWHLQRREDETKGGSCYCAEDKEDGERYCLQRNVGFDGEIAEENFPDYLTLLRVENTKWPNNRKKFIVNRLGLGQLLRKRQV